MSASIALTPQAWAGGPAPRAADSGSRAYATSLVLHVIAGALVVAWTFRHIEAPPAEDAPVEMVIVPPEPEKPQEIVPPKAVQQLQPVTRAEVPRPATAPAPARADTSPPLQNAEPVADAPPPLAAAPVATAPAAPAAQPAVAPAKASAVNDGIPTDYVNKVFARINRIAAGRYPKSAMLKGQEGRVAYRLVLNPQGELLSYDIDTSGIEALDKAAEEALKAASPFPKLPDLGGSSYKLSGAIVYKLTS
ncbi:hypothetical protein IGB42_02937 [Andreprevotia sp. IGB-42]|uniref:TonB family protein n=1 Tax=Andreprevotia sp. IGB-42 TaxID=2497473 RepID=UPI0013588179|nr:TonB family protein [Andreprevotia sp. IGB-42]KAF0812645.1 hypothetical protein IGB42_02937 [Andreprevotia sp. IGB-42]